MSKGELPMEEVSYNGERRLQFNDNWRFQRETERRMEGVTNPNFDDSSWRRLSVPHDWSIELDFNPDSLATHEGGFLDGGVGWYRKTFTIPSTLKGKRISIDFDGVYVNSTTYLNGKRIGSYPFGYNAFSYDITDRLYTDGRENVLVVRVDNTQPSSRWYSGSGIYRNVYLTITNPIHVTRYGTFVTTPDLEARYTDANKADLNLSTKVKNRSGQPAKVKVRSTVSDDAGTPLMTVLSEEQLVEKNSLITFEDETTIASPILWELNNPYRYNLVTEVMVADEVVDTYKTRFGIRYFEFDRDEGFSLNGQYMKLHGVCMHHDLGALGAAINYRAVERQMQIMKNMGVNSIRVSHNPASPELLEVANDLGLLVIDEAFDAWEQAKKTFDYGRFFTEWAEHDIKEMVDRGKNEPSIIMWSIGNEIYDTTTKRGVEIAQDLVRWIKEVDPTRPTTIGEDKTRADKVNETPLDPHIKEIFDTVDIVGLNYSENNYQGYHEQQPDWKLYGSETSSATRSRGVYTHPYEDNLSTGYEDLQQSSYDNDYVAWGRSAEDAWKYDRDLKHLAGQYVWTGFDYIGEPTPYYDTFPAKSSYFGAVDTAGFPKDIYYYYQSQWRDEPMVHILPHWNWSEGEKVRVLVYTNVQKVELFLNGQSLGERVFETKRTSWGKSYLETDAGDTYLEWEVPFEPGTLRAVAKDDNDQVIIENEVQTAGAPVAIQLTADERVIDADGSDLSFVTVDVVDQEGRVVPTANANIHFDITGAGILAGVDNGDAASVERYQDNKRRVFNGKALAILQANEQAGEINLKASASGLLGDSITVFTVDPTDQEQKTIAGIDPVYTTVDLNELPQLPEEVAVFYSDRSVITKAVNWEKVDRSQLEEAGEFQLVGAVEGKTEKAQALITVRDVIAIKPSASVTKVDTMPDLPTEVTLIYNDQSERIVAVDWDQIEADQLVEETRFVITGRVAQTTIKAQHYVTVTNQVDIGRLAVLQNITVNGIDLADFAGDRYAYQHTMPYGNETPEISAIANNGAIVTVLPLFCLAHLIKVHVISEDGQAEAEYMIQLKIAEPQLTVAELSIAETKVTEDDVIDLKVIGYLENGESVDLTNKTPVYTYDDQLLEIDDNKLSALEQGSTMIRASVALDGVTVTTADLAIEITKNPVEKSIESIDEVILTVDKGQQLILPELVTVNYDIGLPRRRAVNWDAVNQEQYSEIGTFEIEGNVANTELKAKAKITVRDAVRANEPVITILPQQVPELPETVTVYFSDHSKEHHVVNWNGFPLEKTKAVGQFELAGSLEEYELVVHALIKVTDQIGRELNISRAKNGYDYPKAEASYTNVAPDSHDRIEAIHDDLISYGNEPHNRWTNYHMEHRPEDWVSITFGDFDPVEYNVDNIEIHWYEDHGVSYPASYKIQYKSGDDWLDVTGLQITPKVPRLEQANHHTFDMVKTSAIRVLMTAQPNKALAITELKIFTRWPKSDSAGKES